MTDVIFYSLYGLFLIALTIGHLLEWRAERKADREWAKFVRDATGTKDCLK